MNPIPPSPPPPEGLPVPARPAPGEFESVLGPIVAAERPKRPGVHPQLPMGAVPLLPPLPGLPLFPVARPDGTTTRTGSPPARGGTTELAGPWGIEVGLRITVLEASGGSVDSPSPGTDAPDPEIVRWIEEAIRGLPVTEPPGSETGLSNARPRDASAAAAPVAANGPAFAAPTPGRQPLEPGSLAPAVGVSPAAVVPSFGVPVAASLEREETTAPTSPDARTRRGGRTSLRSESPTSEESSDTSEPFRRHADEPLSLLDPGALAPDRSVLATSAPAEPDADPLPRDPTEALTHSLPGRLRLAVEDAAGAWELDLHRHAGVMDLVLRGGDDLRLLVRDAARELREAVSAPGALPGRVEWESDAAPSAAAPSQASEQPATSSGTDQQPEFERWRSLVEGRVHRRKPGANRPPDSVAPAHILDRRL